MNNLGKIIFIYLAIHITVFIYQENSKSLSIEERQKLYDETADKYTPPTSRPPKRECERGEKRGENGECGPFYQPGDNPDV